MARPKGARNKLKPHQLAVAKKHKRADETPLQYMLRIMRDGKQRAERRDDMAKAAAPYMHARLQSTTLVGDEDNPLHMIASFLNGRTPRIPRRSE